MDMDIVVNSSNYKLSPNIYKQMAAYGEVQIEYAKNKDKCLSIDCMSKDKLLFDLSWDVTETYDLSKRFLTKTTELYETLRRFSNSTLPMVQPQYFEDQNEEAKKDNVWTPWLSNSTK